MHWLLYENSVLSELSKDQEFEATDKLSGEEVISPTKNVLHFTSQSKFEPVPITLAGEEGVVPNNILLEAVLNPFKL